MKCCTPMYRPQPTFAGDGAAQRVQHAHLNTRQAAQANVKSCLPLSLLMADRCAAKHAICLQARARRGSRVRLGVA